MAVIANGPGSFVWTDAVPNHNPGANGAKFAVNRDTHIWYEWINGTTWLESGDRIQRIAGTGAPNYNPGNHQSRLVINQATPTPGLYLHVSGTTWVKLNAETPQTLSLTGQDLSLSGGGGTVTLPSGVEFPLLAPSSASPNYGFGDSAASGMFFDGSLKMQAAEGVTLDILGLDNLIGDGGGINIQSGGGDTGGVFSISSGAGASRGGDFNMAAGASTDGTGGAFIATAGNSTNGAGGGFTAQAGDGASGGTFLLKAGTTTLEGEFGGSLDIRAGSNTAASEPFGGIVSILGGNGLGADGLGGAVNIYGGNGGGAGGPIILKAGSGAAGVKAAVVVDNSPLKLGLFTTTQRGTIISPANGMLIYNTTTNKFQGYANGAWVDLN